MSDPTPVIATEGFYSLFQSLQANIAASTEITSRHLPSTSTSQR